MAPTQTTLWRSCADDLGRIQGYPQKNLGDSRAFIDSIWKKVKRDFQYQDKLVQDWAAHLEYLQFILIKFDFECASEEITMIWYF